MLQATDSEPVRLTRSPPFDLWPEYLSASELQIFLNILRTTASQLARAKGQHFGRLLRVPKAALRQQAA